MSIGQGDAAADLLTAADTVGRRRGVASANTALRVLRSILSGIASVGVVIFAWWFFLEYFNVSSYSGKGPSDVWHYLFSGADAEAHRQLMIDGSAITLRDAFLGLVFGTAAALAAAIAFNVSKTTERTVMPLAMVLRSVPLVAMTPLIVLIFGRGLTAVRVIAGIVTFFPTLVNVTLALRATPQASIDLFRAYGSGPIKTLRKVQLPNALPAIFASLRVAAPLALVGAVLVEFLVTGSGLGYLIETSMTSSVYNQLWAGVALITLYSTVLYTAISGVEKLVLARFADTPA